MIFNYTCLHSTVQHSSLPNRRYYYCCCCCYFICFIPFAFVGEWFTHNIERYGMYRKYSDEFVPVRCVFFSIFLRVKVSEWEKERVNVYVNCDCWYSFASIQKLCTVNKSFLHLEFSSCVQSVATKTYFAYYIYLFYVFSIFFIQIHF